MKKSLILLSLFQFILSFAMESKVDSIKFENEIKKDKIINFVGPDHRAQCHERVDNVFYDPTSGIMIVHTYAWDEFKQECVKIIEAIGLQGTYYSCGEYDAAGNWLGPCPVGSSGGSGCPPGQNCNDEPAP